MKDYKGTKTYMAPEIKRGIAYDGRQIDIFSSGVILFILVVGQFPFTEATASEKFYSMLIKNQYTDYWQKVSNG